MKSNWIKALTKIAVKSKDTIIKYAPQIMAGCGAACFVAATVCAVKETPDAMEKLKEKEALDPEMTVLQKAAVIVPEYKKTLIFTGAGGALTLEAWKIEATRFAEMAACLAAAMKDNDRLVAAAKEVVGEEKTQDILDKKRDMLENDLDAEDEVPFYNQDNIPYPFLFPNGTKKWMTWGNFKWHYEQLMQEAAENRGLRVYSYFSEFGIPAEELDTTYIKENGWQPSAGSYAMNWTSSDWLQWAREVLSYDPIAYEEDHYRHISGWKINWSTMPEKWDDARE